MKKTLLIGPLSPPITGNSIANDTVLKGLKVNKSVNIEYINTQFEVFDNKLGKFNLKKVYFSIKKYSNLYKIYNSDVIYITPGQTFLGVLKYAPFIYFSKFLNKKIVLHIHGNYLGKQYELLTGFKKYIFKKILIKADKGIVLSKLLLNNLKPFISSKQIFIVPNFVEKYLRPSNFDIEEKKSLKIIFLSNLMKEKGVLDLIEALKNLKKENIKFEAKFAGNIEEQLKKEIIFFSKTENITYLGVVKGKRKKELLAWGNVFVLPTYYKMEGVPISILEAMSNGNIIVTTKHAGIPDIVSNKNGFFVTPKSPKEILEKLKYINSNLSRLNQIRLNNIEESLEYTEEKFIKKITKIIIS